MGDAVDRENELDRDLDEYWDRLVAERGDLPSARSLALGFAATIFHLHARDDASGPNHAFVRTLREELMNRSAMATLPTADADAQALPAPNGNRPRPWHQRATRRNEPLRWLAVAELAAVAAMVVALFWTAFGRDGSIPLGGRSKTEVPASGATDATATHPGDTATANYRGNTARTGVVPGPSLQGEPGLLWRKRYDGMGVHFNGVPVAADGVVYMLSQADRGSTQTVFAINAVTGAIKWTVPTGDVEGVSPVVANGFVYLATAGPQRGGPGADAGYLIALDVETGEEQWRSYTGGVVLSSPAFVGQTVYLRAFDGTLRAIDARTGRQRWRFTVDPAGKPIDDPVVNEGSYHVPSPVSPAVADGLVYAASNTGTLYAIDATSGQERWSFTSDGQVLQTPAVVDGALYLVAAKYFGNDVPDGAGWVISLDAKSGDVRWIWATKSNLGYAAAVSNGLVFVAGRGDEGAMLYTLSAASGEIAWTFTAAATIISEPIVAGETLYLKTADGALNAIDVTTGTRDWRVDLGTNETTDPAISDGVLVLGSYKGTLWGIGSVQGGASVPAASPVANGDVSGLPPCDVEPRAENEPRPEGTPRASLVPVRDNQETGQPAQIELDEIPAGVPANAETVGGIVLTLQQFADCARPGYEQQLRSFYSDDLYRRAWVRAVIVSGDDLLWVITNQTGELPTSFDEVQVLPDGRIGVKIMRFETQGIYLVFVRQGDRWLIDEMLEIVLERWTRPMPTPSPETP